MQLKVFLLIGFVLNAFCLNNLNGGFLSPKYDLRKNESLVESLKKDPSSFAELFTKADPQKTDEIIGLLEVLVAEASAALDLLRSHVTDATNSLNTANSNVQTANNNVQICEDDVQTANEGLEAAQVALDLAETDHSNAVIDQTNAVNDQQEAQSQKDVADQNYAEQSPPLIDEQEVLQQVIDSMGGLKEYERHAHSQCRTGTTPYSGDRTDNPVFGGGGFIGSYTGPQCQALCDDVNNVDSHGRTCVAFEHVSHNYVDKASCALAWACDSTSEWSGGTTYIRKKDCVYDQCPGGIMIEDADYSGINGVYTQSSPSCADFPDYGKVVYDSVASLWSNEHGASIVWYWKDNELKGWGVGIDGHHRYYDGNHRPSSTVFVTDNWVPRTSMGASSYPTVTCLSG